MKLLFYIIIFFLIIPLKASPIVSATWLSQNLCKENIKLIEVGSSYNSYLVEHIKCSQYTNFYKDGWRDNKKKVPMYLPEPEFLINILKKWVLVMQIILFYIQKKILIFILWLKLQQFISHLNF